MKRIRRGATLIELLVALLLLDLAILTLGGMSVVAARRVGEANKRTRAIVAARNRVERTIAGPCGASSSGRATIENGLEEVWVASSIPAGLDIVDSIHLVLDAPTPVVLRARSPC